MKAAVRTKYGGPDVLTVAEVDIPTPGEKEILIRVHAATVNRSDCHVLTGKPFFMRFYTGLLSPKLKSTGCDFAGTVEKTGNKVTRFKVGERVMGFGGVMGIGSHAQYVVVPDTIGMVNIPASMSFEEASACLEGAFYASIPIINLKPGSGQTAMVYGATGAIGTAYLQYLRHFNVSATAVCNTKDFDLVRSLGASKFIDYKKEDFTKDNERYDFVFDAVGKNTFYDCKVLLKEDGKFIWSGRLSNIIPTITTSLLGKKKCLLVPPDDVNAGLMFIKDLLEKGKFKPVIDRTYPLEKIAEAYTYVMSGEKIGNVVLRMN